MQLILLTYFWVLVLDISGFMENVKSGLQKILDTKGTIRLKPFDCSLCMTWWTGLIYLFCVKELTLLNVVFLLILAVNTRIFLSLHFTIFGIIEKFINILYKKL